MTFSDHGRRRIELSERKPGGEGTNLSLRRRPTRVALDKVPEIGQAITHGTAHSHEDRPVARNAPFGERIGLQLQDSCGLFRCDQLFNLQRHGHCS